MELKTKKIFAKELLILFVVLLIQLVILAGLLINNAYQRTHRNKLEIEIAQKKYLSDSLNDPLIKLNLRYSNLVTTLFEQYGTCKGGISDNGLPIAPIPKGFRVSEKIGSQNKDLNPFEEFGGKKTYYKIVFKSYYKNDPLHILTANNSDELINKMQFADSLRYSSIYRKKVYNDLKEVFDSSDCSNINAFNKMLEVPIPHKVMNWSIEAKSIQREADQLNIDRTKTFKNELNKNEIITILKITFFVSFILLFGLRYILLSIMWSINILKK